MCLFVSMHSFELLQSFKVLVQQSLFNRCICINHLIVLVNLKNTNQTEIFWFYCLLGMFWGFFSVRSLTSTIIRRASCPSAPSTTALWTRSTCCAGCRTSSYERWVGRRKHTKKNNPVIKCRIIGGQAGETTQTKTSVE